MKNVFFDTNILFDVIFTRHPFFHSSNHIFKLAEEREITAYSSAVTMSTIYYYLKKNYGHSKAKEKTEILLKIIKWTEVDEAVLISAHASGFIDFEDALQYYSALRVKGIHSIISRNKKDFRHSSLPVISPDEFLEQHFSH